MSHRIISIKEYFIVFAALIGLLLVTIGVAYVDLGRWNFVAALGISTAKTVLILLFFMHLRCSGRLTWVVACAGFFWLAILLVLGMSDFATRHWIQVGGW